MYLENVSPSLLLYLKPQSKRDERRMNGKKIISFFDIVVGITSLCTVAESLRVSAVTNGFPSRSPPIHLPIVIGVGLSSLIPFQPLNV